MIIANSGNIGEGREMGTEDILLHKKKNKNSPYLFV